jgi:hypothetical protein
MIQGDACRGRLFHQSCRRLELVFRSLGHAFLGLAKTDDLRLVLGHNRKNALESFLIEGNRELIMGTLFTNGTVARMTDGSGLSMQRGFSVTP